jgi:Ni/Co efflux regulator RcnB
MGQDHTVEKGERELYRVCAVNLTALRDRLMTRLLISAAALLLLAAPTLAQPVGKASVAPHVQQRAQQQLQRQQSPQRDSGRRGDRQSDRGPRATRPQRQQAAPQERGRRDGYRRNRDDNRGRRDADRTRGYGRDYNRDGRTDYRRAYGGPRRDYSGFRDYHRSFNSSRRFRVAPYRRPAGWYERRWTFGEFLPALFWASSYWLNDFEVYELPPPPYGTVWVRNYNDALLIDRDSGEIISVRYGVFY